MSIDRPPVRPSERLATIALGTALVLLAVAVLAAMHVLGDRLVPPPGHRADVTGSERVLDVPRPETGHIRVPGL